jgi:hypothetical protein
MFSNLGPSLAGGAILGGSGKCRSRWGLTGVTGGY